MGLRPTDNAVMLARPQLGGGAQRGSLNQGDRTPRIRGSRLAPAHMGSPRLSGTVGQAALWDLGLMDALTLALQLRHRYGDVFSLQLAWTPVVVLNGPAVIREALVTYGDTSNRPYTHTAKHLGFRPHAQGKERKRDHISVGKVGQGESDHRQSSNSTGWG